MTAALHVALDGHGSHAILVAETWWMKVGTSTLGCPWRADGATAGLQDAQAALWGTEEQPEPQEATGGLMGRRR